MSDLSAISASARHFALSGPSDPGDAASLPLRGDLAHIALAGKFFVPHYAVPMAHVASIETAIREASSEQTSLLGTLAAGGGFEVLDISGGWAWGATDGKEGSPPLIGYVPMTALTPVA